MQPRNLVIISVVLTAGIGGLELKLGSLGLAGVGLCSILALGLNLILPHTSAQGETASGIVEGQDV